MLIQESKDEEGVLLASGPAQSAMGTKIIRNVLFGGLRYVLVLPIPFFMTPLILRKIGVAGYGTWAVFLAINGLSSLADLGLVGTVSKFVAEYYAHKDFVALTRLLSSGLSLFLLFDVVIGAAFWGATPWFAHILFHGSTVPVSELVLLLRLFQIVVAANILSQLFSSVTTGLQRLDLTHMVSAANVIMNAVLGGLLLLRGSGLRGLVIGYTVSGILTIGAYLILVRELLPQVVLNPLRFDRTEARKMFGYSLRLYITQAAVAVHNQIEKVFLAMLVGVSAVGMYDIASDVALKVRTVIGLILGPLLPAAAELSALGDEVRLKELYYRTHKYLAFFGVPIVFYVAVISKRFVELWIGSNMKMIALPLSVLLAVNFFNLATGPGFLIFAGSGNMKPGVQSALLAIVLNVILSLGLIYKFGFAGAVMGTAGALILASGFFIVVFHRQTGYPVSRVLKSYLKPVLGSTLLLAVVLVFVPTKYLSWFGLIALGLVFGILYTVFILLSQFFDQYDWNKVEGFLPAVRYARRIFRIA
jgi:O-antigen/teichoic acid export membrane protein